MSLTKKDENCFKEIVELFLQFVKPIGNFINYLEYNYFKVHCIYVFWSIMSTLWKYNYIEKCIKLI